MNKVLALVFLFFLLNANFVSGQEGEEQEGSRCSNCQGHEQCCNDWSMGPTCYDPEFFRCVRDNVLCGCQTESCNEDACGPHCFDADLYTCCTIEDGVQRIFDKEVGCPRPSNGTFCGTERCEEDKDCCNDITLGPTCYNPALFRCVMDVVLCGCQTESCNEAACGTVCYDADWYVCCDDQLIHDIDVGCPIIEEPMTCGNKTCPKGDECCEDITLGPVCYSTQSHLCVKDTVLCGCQTASCNEDICGTVCFDADQYVCCDGELREKYIGCDGDYDGEYPYDEEYQYYGEDEDF